MNQVTATVEVPEDYLLGIKSFSGTAGDPGLAANAANAAFGRWANSGAAGAELEIKINQTAMVVEGQPVYTHTISVVIYGADPGDMAQEPTGNPIALTL